MFLNAGTGQFLAAATLNLGESLALADLDDDGHVDIATGTGAAFNNGLGLFPSVATFSELGEVLAVRAVDIDIDGDRDLLISRNAPYPQDPIVLLFNDGSGGFPVLKTIARPANVFGLEEPVLVGHIDRDGALDLVVIDFRQVRVYRSRP